MIKMRLMALLPQAKKQILLMVLWQWLALGTQIVMVSVIAFLLEKGFENALTKRQLLTMVILLAGALAFRFFCDRRAVYASYRASADVKLTLRDRIYQKLLTLGAAYQEQAATSSVVQMAAEGVEQLEVYFGKYLPQLLYSLLAPVTLFFVLCGISLKASVVLLVCVPLIPLSIVLVQKYAKRLLKKYWGAYEGLGDSFLENLQGLTTLKIYQADGHRAQEMDREAQYFRKITMKVLTMQLNSTSIMDILAYGGAAAGMLLAVSEFIKGQILLGQMLQIVLLASEFFIPLRLLGSFFHIAMNGMAASDKIFDLLDLPEEETGEKMIQEKNLSVLMEQVNFSYDQKRQILQEVSLELNSGSFVSLVGESGCGKSTVASLLMKRKRRYQGRIVINGETLSDISEQEVMKKVTLVTNNSYIFQGTVAENLRMGKPDADEKEMIKALQKVALWEYFESLQGLDTPVMEKGENFSGGQCQRLALARALLHDSPVYIFDEATSNIDVESEEKIMQVIGELSKSRTILFISHRLANVVHSDCIYMMEKGRVVQKGTHEELMKEAGSYRLLFESQQHLEHYGRERCIDGR